MKAPFAIAVAAVLGSFCLTEGGSRIQASTFPNDPRTIAHVLNRIAFGPRQGDIDRVGTIGLERYIDEQLHPDRVADRSMEMRLESLDTTKLSSREIALQYALPALEARQERQRQMKEENAGGADQPMRPDPQQQRANLPLIELSEEKLLRAI